LTLSPLYVATIECCPALRTFVLSEATPAAPTVLVPIRDVPSLNVTVPVTGSPDAPATTAVKMIGVPEAEGLLLELSELAVTCRIACWIGED
jgi:hypothetical protein